MPRLETLPLPFEMNSVHSGKISRWSAHYQIVPLINEN